MYLDEISHSVWTKVKVGIVNKKFSQEIWYFPMSSYVFVISLDHIFFSTVPIFDYASHRVYLDEISHSAWTKVQVGIVDKKFSQERWYLPCFCNFS